MSTYNTGNPLGSADPRDLYDNAENLDDLANNQDKTEHPDRLGVPRKTWHGMEREHDAAQSSRDVQFQSAQSSRDNQFHSAQSYREAAFSNFLQASGYQDLGEYAPGIEITAHNQYVTFGGQPYLLKPSVPVPYTTSGEWTGDDFKLIGDHSLRQDLANPGKGAAMVARGVVAVDGLKGLAAIPLGLRRADLRYENDGFYAGSVVGGGAWKWKAVEPKSNHNGGTVVDPDRVNVWEGTQSDLTTLFSVAPSGTGCFVRILNCNELSCDMFGILPGTTAREAFIAAFETADNTSSFLVFPEAAEYAASADVQITVNNVKMKSPHNKKTTLKDVRFIVAQDIVTFGVGHSGTDQDLTYTLEDNNNTNRVVKFHNVLVTNIDRYFVRDMKTGAEDYFYSLLEVLDSEFIDNNVTVKSGLSHQNGFLFRLSTPCEFVYFHRNKVVNLGNSADNTGSRALSYTPDARPYMGTCIANDNYFENIFGGGVTNNEVHAMMSFARVSYFENNELHNIHSNTEEDGEDKEGIYTKSTYTYFIRNRCYNASGRHNRLDAASLIAKGGYALLSYAEGNEVRGGSTGIALRGVYTIAVDNICDTNGSAIRLNTYLPDTPLSQEYPWLDEAVASGQAPLARSVGNTCYSKPRVRTDATAVALYLDGPAKRTEILGGSYIAEPGDTGTRAESFYKVDGDTDGYTVYIRDATFIGNRFHQLSRSDCKEFVIKNSSLNHKTGTTIGYGDYGYFHFSTLESSAAPEEIPLRINANDHSSTDSVLTLRVDKMVSETVPSSCIRLNTPGDVYISGNFKILNDGVGTFLEATPPPSGVLKRLTLDRVINKSVSALVGFRQQAATIEEIRLTDCSISSETDAGLQRLDILLQGGGVSVETFLFDGNIFNGSFVTLGQNVTLQNTIIGANNNDLGL